MDLRNTKSKMRDMLGRMLAGNVTDIVLMVNCAPEVKVDGEWEPWGTEVIPAVELNAIAQAITRPEQWQESPVRATTRTCSGHLLALGIGRFRISAVAYEPGRVFSVSLRPESTLPPAADGTVPFVPADHPPSLSTSAAPGI